MCLLACVCVLMAVVLAAADVPSVPIADTKVLAFPAAGGWLSQVAYAPPRSQIIFWDLGYFFDDLKTVHQSYEFSKLVKDVKELSVTMGTPEQLHLRGKVLRRNIH